MTIPLIEPDLTEAEAQAAARVIRSGRVNEGVLTAEFEQRFAQTVGTRYAVATTSCTAALAVSLMALGIKGREVIVPDLTMIGTAMAVLLSGNEPLVVDVRPQDGCLDAARVERALTARTAAVIPVHVNGRNALTPDLAAIARRRRLAIVEDAACCLGSQVQEDGTFFQLGTQGTLGCFSLAATKIITTGQGGVIVTNDPALHERCVRLKDWGRFGEKGTNHPAVGFNFKFTDIQAAIGLQQLERLPELMARKRALYARYRARLGALMLTREDPPGFCPWYVDVTAQHLTERLTRQGIGATPIWPPLHRQGAMGMTNADDRYPCATALGENVLWLPSSTKLTDAQIDAVCDAVDAAVEARV